MFFAVRGSLYFISQVLNAAAASRIEKGLGGSKHDFLSYIQRRMSGTGRPDKSADEDHARLADQSLGQQVTPLC